MTPATASRPAVAATGGPQVERLTAADRMYLHDESEAWPCHFGGLAIVDGRPLLDASGRLRLDEIRTRLEGRVARVPELRQRLLVPASLRGGPLWVDDDGFAIEHHVHEAPVPPPGGEAELLAAAATVYAELLDRTRPLWELWFLTGLGDGRVGILLKLHHAIADGTAAVGVMASLFDPEPDAPDPVPERWHPRPVPRDSTLVADNLARRLRGLAGAAANLAHPGRIVNGARIAMLVTRRMVGQKGAPRTSLNGVVQAGRRLGLIRLDLAAVKDVAHARGGKVNDVVLALWAGGLRALLVSRAEAVDGVELVVGQAVSLRPATEDGPSVDNQAGTVVFRLPTNEEDPRTRLDRVIETTRRAKAMQNAGAIMGVMAALSATPIGRYFNTRQRAVNVIVTNVVGPRDPMYVLGARILEIAPIIQLVGNIGLTLCAFSYAGRLSVVVTADATGFPDIDTLVSGMERDWNSLLEAARPEPVPA